MEAEELIALLEAAAREISAVSVELAGEGGEDAENDPVCSELLKARAAVDEAVTAAGSAVRSDTCDSEVVRDALALRAEAVRARDLAETRLWGIQDEHAELLEQLQRLTFERAKHLQEQRADAESAAAREADLVARCEDLGVEVRSLREEVDRKSQRLIASSTLGHSLDLSRRRLQRLHDGSLAENTVAREILALQHSTETYLQRVQAEGDKVNESLWTAKKQCEERMESLRTEWAEQQQRYQDEMAMLQNRLAELQEEYELRWKTTDRESKEKLDEKARMAAEVRANFEERLAKLDAEWESEAAAAREELDRQKQLLAEARQNAISDMEAKLSERQQQLEAAVDVERQRCAGLRDKQHRKIVNFETEVNRYKKNINDLSSNYRSKRRAASRGPSLAPSLAPSVVPSVPCTPRAVGTAGSAIGMTAAMSMTSAGSPRSQVMSRTAAMSMTSAGSPRAQMIEVPSRAGHAGLWNRGSPQPGSRQFALPGFQE